MHGLTVKIPETSYQPEIRKVAASGLKKLLPATQQQIEALYSHSHALPSVDCIQR
jgi:hypothetical protein